MPTFDRRIGLVPNSKNVDFVYALFDSANRKESFAIQPFFDEAFSQ
jgi:hypothetical protein